MRALRDAVQPLLLDTRRLVAQPLIQITAGAFGCFLAATLLVAARGIRWDASLADGLLISGIAEVVPHHPLLIAARNTWSLQHYLSAALLLLGFRAPGICGLWNVCQIALPMLGAFVFAHTLTRRAFPALAAPVLLVLVGMGLDAHGIAAPSSATDTAASAGDVPRWAALLTDTTDALSPGLVWPSYTSTGPIAAGLGLLVWALWSGGYLAAAWNVAFLAALVHPGMGLVFGVALIVRAYLLHGSLPLPSRRTRYRFAPGLLLALVAFAVYLLVRIDVPDTGLYADHGPLVVELADVPLRTAAVHLRQAIAAACVGMALAAIAWIRPKALVTCSATWTFATVALGVSIALLAVAMALGGTALRIALPWLPDAPMLFACAFGLAAIYSAVSLCTYAIPRTGSAVPVALVTLGIGAGLAYAEHGGWSLAAYAWMVAGLATALSAYDAESVPAFRAIPVVAFAAAAIAIDGGVLVPGYLAGVGLAVPVVAIGKPLDRFEPSVAIPLPVWTVLAVAAILVPAVEASRREHLPRTAFESDVAGFLGRRGAGGTGLVIHPDFGDWLTRTAHPVALDGRVYARARRYPLLARPLAKLAIELDENPSHPEPRGTLGLLYVAWPEWQPLDLPPLLRADGMVLYRLD